MTIYPGKVRLAKEADIKALLPMVPTALCTVRVVINTALSKKISLPIAKNYDSYISYSETQ